METQRPPPRRRRRLRPATTFALPINLYLIAWTVGPLLYMLYLSMTDWKIPLPRHFIGLGNYVEAFNDPLFRYSLRVTITYAFAVAAIEVVLGLFVALLLARPGRLATVTRAVFVVPLVLTPIVTAMMWRGLFNPTFSPLNYLLGFIGLGPYEWLSSSETVWVSLVAIDVWQWLPFPALLILSGIFALPREQVEAAQVDGASKMQQLIYVTVPMLRSVIMAAFMLRFLDGLKIFDNIFVLTRGGPGTLTEMLSFHIYRFGLGQFFRVGYGSAMSIVVVLATLAVTALVLHRFLKEPVTHA